MGPSDLIDMLGKIKIKCRCCMFHTLSMNRLMSHRKNVMRTILFIHVRTKEISTFTQPPAATRNAANDSWLCARMHMYRRGTYHQSVAG